MATSLASDFKVYEEEFQGSFVETVMQNIDAFNAAAAGALMLDERPLLGNYEKEAFWDEIINANSALTRRDITSTSSVTAVKLTQDEFIGVKLNRRNGPYQIAVDAVRKAIDAAASPEMAGREFSNVIGQQTAAEMPREMLDRALAALEAKLDSVAALEEDDTAAVITTEGLVDALSKFGDAAQNIRLWVMHSKVYYNLLKDQVSDAVYRADGVEIMEGVPATLGRPVLITDSASLKASNGVSTGVDAYSTLGLVPGAAQLTFSEPPFAWLTDPQTGSENIYLEWQGEYAFNLKLRGCQWDTGNGGSNPTNAAVATATNWDTVVADNKLLPGVILKTR